MAVVLSMIAVALNAGSSSLKFSVAKSGSQPSYTGSADGFGQPDARLQINDHSGKAVCNQGCATLQKAAGVVLDFIGAQDIPVSAIGHRIVHGGPRVLQHCLVDRNVRALLSEASAMAPLHNPPALDVLDMAQAAFPQTPQVACLDTAFHASLPPVATRFPLPMHKLGEGIRRYGFHGLSCESILDQLNPIPQRLVIAHLGGGASVTAVLEGTSCDTSMGLTPDGGLVMETRSGDLDPGLLVWLLRHGETADSLEDLLNRSSGMAGISGRAGDPRVLRAAAGPYDILALEIFVHGIAKAIAGMGTVLGGIDLLVFTGGIGTNDADLRTAVLARLAWLGDIPSKHLLAQEEAIILRHCYRLVAP